MDPRVIDFDWAGEVGQVHYLAEQNTEIQWPGEAGGPIEQDGRFLDEGPTVELYFSIQIYSPDLSHSNSLSCGSFPLIKKALGPPGGRVKGTKVLVLANEVDKEMYYPAQDTPLSWARGSENWDNTLLCQMCLSRIIGPTMMTLV